MRQFSSNMIGVDQGSVVLFSDFKDGGVMWTGEGPREMRRAVSFSQSYLTAPAVQVALSMWDLDQATNARVDLATEGVTETGFTLVFRTWGDTRIARARADWMAIGELECEDNWQVD